MRRTLALLRRQRAGGAAMEMALIAPVVFAMLMVGLDFSGAWSMKLNLENAAQRGIELAAIRRGVAPDYNYILTETVNAWGRPYSNAAVDFWLECGGVRQGSTTASCNGAQVARYVSVVIRAEYVPYFGWGGVISGNSTNGGFVVSGDATVRVQ